ncbi:MAG: AAC(3)-I family aminoglycoside N-acetyltransferase [Proteobacteria bacterium]|nr:AAC(3)-I family aminoglycoside N-acetyltransferase [Pseudomonadota bacterium]
MEDIVPGAIKIARLTADSLPQMRSLLDMFGVAFDDLPGYSSHQPDDRYLRDLLAERRFIAIAASDDNSVVGGLVAYELVKFEQKRSEIYLYDLAVAEAWRRRGIATGLIEALRGSARSVGACVIFVQADHGDDPAIALYTKLGVREDVMHFDIAVAPRADD